MAEATESRKDPGRLLEKYRYLQLSIVAFLLWLFSFLTHAWLPGLAILEALLRDGAIALTIAIVLAFTADKFAKKKIDQMVADSIQKMRVNVWKGIYGRDLPDPLIDEVEGTVLETKFVRSEYKINVELEPIQRDVVRKGVHVRYSAKNIGYAQESYPVSGIVSLPTVPGLEKECKFIQVSCAGKLGSFDYNEDDLKSDTSVQ